MPGMVHDCFIPRGLEPGPQPERGAPARIWRSFDGRERPGAAASGASVPHPSHKRCRIRRTQRPRTAPDGRSEQGVRETLLAPELRESPCQGEGRGFESRRPLHSNWQLRGPIRRELRRAASGPPRGGCAGMAGRGCDEPSPVRSSHPSLRSSCDLHIRQTGRIEVRGSTSALGSRDAMCRPAACEAPKTGVESGLAGGRPFDGCDQPGDLC